jgi:type I restriction enzyme, R subunit
VRGLDRFREYFAAWEGRYVLIGVNPTETARLAFDTIVQDRLQEIVETNFKLYKRVADDDAFARVLVDWLYDRFRKEVE